MLMATASQSPKGVLRGAVRTLASAGGGFLRLHLLGTFRLVGPPVVIGGKRPQGVAIGRRAGVAGRLPQLIGPPVVIIGASWHGHGNSLSRKFSRLHAALQALAPLRECAH